MLNSDLNSLWRQALSIIEKQLSKPSFETWLKPVKLVSSHNQTMLLEVPNDFAKDWLEARYYQLITESLEEVTNQKVDLAFVLSGSANPSADLDNNLYSDHSVSASAEDNFPISLNPKYTFETFIVGEGSKFAHSAALAVAEAPAERYNPLFLYGGAGLGKTHLMQAIGHAVIENIPTAKVSYVSSENFTMELINSIRDNQTVNFRNKYRSIDVLIIDDIQFLSGKERTQEEFFHTFNALYEANKQIIISSNQSPKQLPVLDNSLRSRFKGGLIVDIHPPDLNTRISILKKRAQSENLQVPSNVIDYIAELIPSNIRELDGAFTRVTFFSSVKQCDITLELASEALNDIFI